jgi:site-specific recombinase XerD
MLALSTLDHPLSPAFATLLGKVEDRYDRSFLRRLFSFASSHGLAPADIDAALLAAFADAIAAGIKRPKQVVRNAVKVWNRMAETIEDWPATPLPLTDSHGWRALPLGDFAKSFGDDCEAFLHQSEGKGLFDARGLPKLSPATITDRRNKLRQFATRLVEAGRPAASIKKLADLVEPEAVRLILEGLWKEADEAPNAHAANLARLLALIAEHWAYRPADEVMIIKRAAARLRPRKEGMTEGNRAKLRPFTDEANLKRLVNLPRAAVAALDRDRPTVTDAVVVQSALAVAILLTAPIREKNLVALDLVTHIDRVNKDQGFLVIPAHEVKNARGIELPLSASALKLLDLYVEVYRPLLLKGALSSKLFVSWNGRQKTPDQLGAQLPRFIRDRTGLDMHLHLFRHLAGFVFLRDHPGEYETVRRLLGHGALGTTVGFYTGLEHADAFRRYDQVLDRYRQEDEDDV